jgi:sugar porter (SP) family MFS transporter
LEQGEIIDGTLNIFAALGALIAAKIADGPLGRRGCLACSAASYLFGVCVSAVALDWYMVAAGRALCGIAVGLSFSSGGLYLTEIAPAHLRGMLGSLYDLGIDLGIVLGSLVGYVAMATDTALFGSRWRFMVGFGAAMPAFVLMAVPFLPESPRWLLANCHPEEARETLLRLYGSTAQVDKAALEFQQVEVKGGDMATWRDFFFELRTDTGSVRKTLLLVMALGILQQATGSESILSYCHVFLREAGMTSPLALGLGFIFVGLSKLAGNFFPLLFSDTYGRLPFLRASSVGVAGALFALIIVCNSGTHGVAEVVLMCIFLFFFSLGIGTLLWVIVPELLPFRWRARGLAAVVILNRLTSATVTLTALSIIKLVQVTGFFTLYLGFAVVSLMVTFMMLPETAGRSLESITNSASQEALAKCSSQEALIRKN